MSFVSNLARAATTGLLVCGLGLLAAGHAGAAEPMPWQTGFQPAASPTMVEIQWFNNNFLLPIIVSIVVFVMAILGYVIWRFSETRNPVAARTTHHTLLEVAWTVVPAVILVVLAVPSFRLLYFADHVEEAEMTVKAIGNQWYWTYEYPDQGDISFDASMLQDDKLQEGQPRLLATDNAVVLPVDTNIRLLITASDVLHSFAMPSMGLKLDAVPGQTNETWVRISEEGVYYGQCSELCGKDHSYMPIMVKAVAKPAFEAWVKTQTASRPDDQPPQPVRLAAAPGARPAANQ